MRHVSAIARLFPHRAHALLCAAALTIAAFGASWPSPGNAREMAAPQLGTRIGGIIAGGPSWHDWKEHFLASDGRIVDTGNKGISHSEGQGYGMLLAVAADDRRAFDRIWAWTRANLGPRADGLFMWRWSPDPKTALDRNNATDGDILITWALAEASDHWNDAALRDEAVPIANAIGRKLVVSAQGYGPVLLPGVYGFDGQAASDGPIVNLSYWLFPAFHRLSQLAPETDWAAIAQTGMKLMEQARASGRPPADWLSLAKPTPQPALRFPAQFGYDALRIPLYLSLAGGNDPELLRSFPIAKNGMAVVSARDGAPIENAVGDGYSAIAALVRCATDRTPFPRALTAQTSNDAYYPATLRLLAQIAALADPTSCIGAAQAAELRFADWSPRRPALPVSPSVIFSELPTPATRPLAKPVEAVVEPAPGFDASWLLALPLLIGASLGSFALVRRKDAASHLSVEGLAAEPRRMASPPARPALAAPARMQPAASEADLVPVPPNAREIAAEMHKGGVADNLAAHIQLAAETSAQWRQQVGVIVYAHCGNKRSAVSDVSRAVSALRRTIRAADRVETIGPTEIGVCVSLLRDDAQLGLVVARFDGILRREFAMEPDAGEPPFTSIRKLVSHEMAAKHDVIGALRKPDARDERKREALPQAPDSELPALPETVTARPKTTRARKSTAATPDTGAPAKRKRATASASARNSKQPNAVAADADEGKAGVNGLRLSSDHNSSRLGQ